MANSPKTVEAPPPNIDRPIPDQTAPLPEGAQIEQPTSAVYDPTHTQEKPEAAPPRFEFGRSYIFRLRQHTKTSFSGLWELCVLNDQGQVIKQIADADAISFCLDNLMGHLEAEGI